MLKTMKDVVQTGAVISFKLVTGEEVVAKVTDVDVSEIEISDPVVLINTPEGVALAPAFMTSAENRKLLIREFLRCFSTIFSNNDISKTCHVF